MNNFDFLSMTVVATSKAALTVLVHTLYNTHNKHNYAGRQNKDQQQSSIEGAGQDETGLKDCVNG